MSCIRTASGGPHITWTIGTKYIFVIVIKRPTEIARMGTGYSLVGLRFRSIFIPLACERIAQDATGYRKRLLEPGKLMQCYYALLFFIFLHCFFLFLNK